MTNQTSSNKYSDRIAGLETDIANTSLLKDQLASLGNNKKASRLLSANAQTKQGTELLKKVLISDDATLNQNKPQGSNSPQNNSGNQSQGSNSPQNNSGNQSQGSQGSNQSQGSQGSNQSQGSQGSNQSQGSQGNSGSQSGQGSQGASGTSASQGNSGSQSGQNGTPSNSGTPNQQGSQGQPMSNGSQGASNGSQGTSNGSQGNSGTASSQGNGSPQTKSKLQSLADKLSNVLSSMGQQSGNSNGSQGNSQSGQGSQGNSNGSQGNNQSGQGSQGSNQSQGNGQSQGSQGTPSGQQGSQGNSQSQGSQGNGDNPSGKDGTDQSQDALSNKLSEAQNKLNKLIQSKQNPNKQTVEGEITVNGEKHKIKLQRDITTEVKGNDEHARKEARSMVNNTLAKADQKMRIEASKGNKNAGAGGAQLARDAQIINASEMNWKVILEKFCKQYSKALYSPTHYNRSVAAGAGAFVPGRIKQKQKDNYVPGIEILVDTSGSVSDEDLNYYMGVIASIFKKYKVTGELIYWSVGIDNIGEFNDMVSLRQINPASKGGTDIMPVFDYLMGRTTFTDRNGKALKCKTKPKEMNLILIFTDGVFDWDFDDSTISAFKHKIYWLAYPSYSKYIYQNVESHKGFGNVAQIHREADR